MKTIATIFCLLSISSTVFASIPGVAGFTQASRERAAKAAKSVSVAVTEASLKNSGVNLDDVLVYVYTANEIKRTQDLSTIVIVIKVDYKDGMVIPQSYEVEVNQVGFVQSIRAVETPVQNP